MPIDYYVGRTTQELELLLRAAQDRKAKGAITSVNAAGTGGSRDFSQLQAVEREIADLLYSLYLRDPDTYPNPRTQRITRTRARYVTGGPLEL